MNMRPQCLSQGDTIGLVAPCHVAERERYAPILDAIRSLGFQVRLGDHFFRNTYGYLASEEERAEDINSMAREKEVKMVLFGGGEGGEEVLPYLDYSAIRAHPKFYVSYSDGTSILSAITRKTGLVTYYGALPGMFENLTPYNKQQFFSHFVEGPAKEFVPSAPWRLLCPGEGTGILAGGYLGNAALLTGGQYFPRLDGGPYLLFLEDHERFSSVAHVSALISHLEQSGLAFRTAGLLFGHYSLDVPAGLLERLKRFGLKYGVPVAYCDDFGHGENHGILPMGRMAVLNTDEGTLQFCGVD